MESFIESARSISCDLEQSLEALIIPKEDSCLIPAAFYSIAIEHHRSIIELVDRRLIGSASTLMRSLFEAYVKGLWFSKCGKEADFESLRKDKFEKKFYQLIQDIEAVQGVGIGQVKDDYWSLMNSLTHSGLLQLGRRFNEDFIVPNYSDEFKIDTLRFASNYGFLASSKLAEIAKNVEALKAVLVVSKKYNLPR